MKVSLIQPKMQRRPVDTSLKARMSPHLGLLADVRQGTLKREYLTGADFKSESLAAPDFSFADPVQCLYGNVIAASRGCPFACDFCKKCARNAIRGLVQIWYNVHP